MTIAFWLVLAIFGVVGAAVAAALQAPPAALSGALIVAFGGLTGGAVACARALHAPNSLTEPREPRGPSPVEAIPADLTRPAFGGLWLAAAGTFGLLGLVPLIALARRPGRSEFTGWRSGVRLVDEHNQPIRIDRLDDGGVDTVFPQGGVNVPQAPAVLVRVVATYFAYSKICTHAGCPVALYRHATRQLICPCHQSIFDVLSHAKPLSGPAPRALPQLPLGVDAEGYLIAQGDFDAPVGPDDWDRVS